MLRRETRVTTSDQTAVPADLRAHHQLQPGDMVVWEQEPGGALRVSFRKRTK